MEEFFKSIKAILYDRIVSPLSGTFIVSWALWNWKLLYFFFIFDANQTVISKIAYISTTFNNWKILTLYPILSTVFLIVIYPIISTGAFWMHLKYKNWQNRIKNEIEKNRLLTLEQSIKILGEIRKQEERFLEIEKSKDLQIESLKNENIILNENLRSIESKPEIAHLKSPNINEINDGNEEMNSFLSSDYGKQFEKISNCVTHNWRWEESDIDATLLSAYIGFDIVKKTITGLLEFTDKGKKYLKKYLDNEIANNKS